MEPATRTAGFLINKFLYLLADVGVPYALSYGGYLMRRFFFLAIFGLCLSQTALADISCTPTQAIPQQNRTRMKHRIPPSVNPHVYQVTVAQMAGAPPASGVSVAGFRM